MQSFQPNAENPGEETSIVDVLKKNNNNNSYNWMDESQIRIQLNRNASENCPYWDILK